MIELLFGHVICYYYTMLIIGHRGAAGLAPENSLEALRLGQQSGAHMLEFDVRLTKDKVLVINHDASLWRTHRRRFIIANHTYAELQALQIVPHIATLKEVLLEFSSAIQLNIELKDKGSGIIALAVIRKHVDESHLQKSIILSSFDKNELAHIRQYDTTVRLALLQHYNPYAFTNLSSLHLTAVGFYRLNIPNRALEIAKREGLFTYAYTVNTTKTALRLQEKGVEAIVTNYPDRFTTV